MATDPPSRPGPSDTIRYGVIGTGMMGIEHIENLKAIDGAEVTAIADPDARSRGWAIDALGPVATFDDHRALLDSGRCDAVVIVTPNMTHVDVMTDVLGTDHHVMVEKPLCTTVADCRKVIDAARDHRGVVWVGLEYRYMPPVARLVAAARQGELGRVRMIGIREHRFPFLAKVGNWNRFNRNSGGTLVEKCCHFFDLMNLVAEAEPVRVMASGGQDVNHLDESYDGETPDVLDNAFVIVDYDNGVRAMLDLCMFAEASLNQEEIAVTGDEAKAEAFLPSGEYRLGRRVDGRPGVSTEIVTDPAVRYEGHHHGSSYLEHLDFLAAVRSGAPPAVALEDGLRSVALGVASQRSIAEERIVEMDEVLTDPVA